jgi:hypothetical protein
LEKPDERGHLDKNVGGWIILKWIFDRSEEVICTGLVRIRIDTSGRLL